jgi:hypothetical protein
MYLPCCNVIGGIIKIPIIMVSYYVQIMMPYLIYFLVNTNSENVKNHVSEFIRKIYFNEIFFYYTSDYVDKWLNRTTYKNSEIDDLLKCLAYEKKQIIDGKELFLKAEQLADLGFTYLIESVLKEFVLINEQGKVSLNPGK